MTRQEFTQKMEFSKDVKDLPAMFCIQKEYIASLEAENAKLRAEKDLMYDVAMKGNHEFGLTMQYANEVVKLKKEIAQLRADNKALIEQVNECYKVVVSALIIPVANNLYRVSNDNPKFSEPPSIMYESTELWLMSLLPTAPQGGE